MKDYVYIESYGCSANLNNSEILKGLLKQSGYEITNNEKIAGMIVLNSCVVKGKTESKIKRRIQDIARAYKDKLIIITGCMPETDYRELKKLAPNSIFLGTHNLREIVKLIRSHNENKLTEKIQKEYLSGRNEEKILLPKVPENKLISITQISEGCFGDCSYCKTRLAKGRLFSYPADRIVKSVESDLINGAKEVWITSQDNASYGLDLEEKKLLPELLNRILNLKHNFKLRLGMMNPNHLYPILREIIEVYKSPKMYKFLHIPIQSASNRVLRDMNREYKIESVEGIAGEFKREFPEITIATDIITGYPTETEGDHRKNVEFIRKFRPDVFNLSKFSRHQGTKAEKLKGIGAGIINKRTTELMQVHRTTAMENKERFIGRILRVFVDKKTEIPDIYEARDDSYNIILINSREKILGKSVIVKIKIIGVHHMIGEIIRD